MWMQTDCFVSSCCYVRKALNLYVALLVPWFFKLSGGPPMVCFEVIRQGDLLFEFIDCLPTHGLLASNGRIRRIAIQSQARMVGGVEALQLVACQSFAA